MKKKWLIAAAVVLAVVVYWRPMSLADAVLAADGSAGITWVETIIEGSGLSARAGVEHADYEVRPGSPEAEELGAVLEKYTYHRCLRTPFSDGSMNGKGGGMASLHLRSAASLSNLGSGEIVIDGVNYRMDYVGRRSSMALMEDMEALLETWTPVS